MRIDLVVPAVLGLGLTAGLGVLACSNPSTFSPDAKCTFDNDASAGEQGTLTQIVGDGGTAQASAQVYLLAHLVDIDEEALCEKTIIWTAGTNSGSVSLGQSITDVAGLAATVWTLGPAAGTQTVTATVQNSDPTISAVFTATATAPGVYRLAIVSGDEQTGPVGTVLPQPTVVQFVDASGNPGPATILTWRVTNGDGTVAQATTTSDALTGRSQNSWTLGTAGTSEAVTVSEPDGSSVVFTATSTRVVYQLAIVSGDQQTAAGGSHLPQPLVVKFASANGTPGPQGTVVHWRVTDGGGTVAQASTTTDASGLSQNDTWVLGHWNPNGMNTQRVTATEIGGSGVAFIATATASGGLPKAEIRAYNGTQIPGVLVSLDTPYDGPRTLGPIAPGFSFPDSVQVAVGVDFTISTTIAGHTGTVTCTTTTAIIPVPGDPLTGNAIVTVVLVGSQPVLACSGGWH